MIKIRWLRKEIPLCETRIKNHFLFLPLCIHGEWRWLEKATYRQKYCNYNHPYHKAEDYKPWDYDNLDWWNIDWID